MPRSDRRSTSNGNSSGNSYQRRARRRWMISPEAGFGGNGETVPCALKYSKKCLGVVDIVTLWVDRIIPGCEGGKYTRDNIRPSCEPCNVEHGSRLGLERRRAIYGY